MIVYLDPISTCCLLYVVFDLFVVDVLMSPPLDIVTCQAPVKTSSEWPLSTRGPSPLQLAIDFAARKGGGEGVEGMRKEFLGKEERSAKKSAEARKIG